MRRTSILAALLTIPSAAFAIPFELNHQGRILDATTGAPLDGTHDLQFTLNDAPSGGSAVWQETASADFDHGYYAARLGGDASNPLTTELFDAPLWLAISVDGGPELPRIPVSSVPYAFVAATAENLSGGVVDASEIKVNGETIIDTHGNLTITDADTLGGLGCSTGQVAKLSGGDWACAEDAVRTDDAIVGAVQGRAVHLAAGSTVDGKAIIAGNDAIRSFIEATGLTLEPSTTLGGKAIATVGDLYTDGAVDAHLSGGVDLGGGSTLGGVLLASVDDVMAAVEGLGTEEKQDSILADLGTMDTKLDDILADTAQCAIRPQYTRTCSDWSSKGWSSVDECLQDGRWHLYATWVNGGITESGGGVGRAKFHAAAVAGADTKLRIGREFYEVRVRTTDAATAFWVFIVDKAWHYSFVMRSTGAIDSVHTGTGASYHDNWRSTDLGNYHYFSHSYTHYGSFTTSQHGGVGAWARY